MRTNPYSEGLGEKGIENIKDICLGRNGVMFRLFDLGKLGIMENERILAYKNSVAALVRKLIDEIEQGGDSQRSLLEFKTSVKKLGRYTLGEGDKISFFEEGLDSIIQEFGNDKKRI